MTSRSWASLVEIVYTPGIRELVVGDFRVFYEVGTQVDVHSVRRASQLIDEDEFDRD